MFKRKPVISVFMTIVTIQSIVLLIIGIVMFSKEDKRAYEQYLYANSYVWIILVLAILSICCLIIINILYFGEKFIVLPEGLITMKFVFKKKIPWENVLNVEKKGPLIVINTIDKCICVHSSKAAEDALPIMLDNMLKSK